MERIVTDFYINVGLIRGNPNKWESSGIHLKWVTNFIEYAEIEWFR